jgi:DNA polymerase III subunit epsilon
MINPITLKPAKEQRYCGIDFEGSGASKVLKDAPVQIGLATLENVNNEVGKGVIETVLDSFINPGQRITYHAYNVHKIGYRDVRHAPRLHTFYSKIQDLSTKAIFVGHSHSTEKRYLRAAFPLLPIEWVDTLPLARAIYPSLSSHKLESCFSVTGQEERLRNLVPNKDWHNALFDAVASLLFLEHCLLLPQMEGITIYHLQNIKNPNLKKSKKSII